MITTPPDSFKETLFEEADDFFKSLLESINNATQEILLETFIFDLDPLGEEILTGLIKASNRGVTVLLYLDGHGIKAWDEKVFKRLAYSGIQWKIHHPLPWQQGLQSHREVLGKKVFSFNAWNFISPQMGHLLKRNHQKKCLVDQKIGFFGSINISQDHSKRLKAQSAWKDIGIRISDKRIDEVRRLFLNHYEGKGLELNLTKDTNLRPAWSAKQKEYYQSDLFQRIRSAKKRIWIATPYLVPDESLISRLSEAQHRGIDVKVLIPLKTDYVFFPAIHRHYVGKLREKRIKVFFYKERFLHAKMFLIDSWCKLGSTNLNGRSAHFDHEFDFVCQSPSGKKQFIQFFKKLMANSHMADDGAPLQKALNLGVRALIPYIKNHI